MLGPEIEFRDRDYIQFKGRKLLYLAGIDYHRMSNNPIIIQSMAEAVQELGLNPTGSRSTTGNHSIYIKLEKRVADFFDTEASVVFPSGYLANIILLQAIAEEYKCFFIDEIAHSSIIDAVNQFSYKIIRFKHLDADDLESKIKKHLPLETKPLIITDGVFPATGEIPLINDYSDLAEKYAGKVLIDDAHAMAVVGQKGKGSWEDKGVDRDLIYQTGTLSKGFGVFGGIIPGSKKLINTIHNKSQAFIGSTGLALPLAAAAISSVSYLIDNRDIISTLQKKTLVLKDRFRHLGFEMPETNAPIFSITYHDADKNQRLFDILLKNNIYPPFINYPGAPPGGHFRFIITGETSDEQIDLLYETIKSSL